MRSLGSFALSRVLPLAVALFLTVAGFAVHAAGDPAPSAPGTGETSDPLGGPLVLRTYLQLGTPTGIVVRWRTDVPTESRVRYGIEPDCLDNSVDGPGGRSLDHEVELTGLQPDTRYCYAVGSPTQVLAGNDGNHWFDTPPLVGTSKPTRIWVLGDSGTGTPAAEAVRDAYETASAGQDTHLWLMLGDNAYPNGTDAQYQNALFDMYGTMLRRAVLWPTIGNHDNVDGPTWPYLDIFTLPMNAEAGGVASGTEQYYSFDYANIHFVVLDSHASNRQVGGPMMTWLEADLAATAQDWIIAYWHHPPYSKGSHDSDNPDGTDLPLAEMRWNSVPLLEDYGVDLVLSGHSHSYERSYLIDGHYGDSTSFVESHKVDGGDGRVTGDGAYLKPPRGSVPYNTAPGDGAVYTVSGSAGQVTSAPLDHPAMAVSRLELGSVILEVQDDRLDVEFLNVSGSTSDEFTIIKTVAPLVDFSASPETGAAPLAVNFTDLSLNQPTQWEWDFDDDGTVDSTEANPTHVYPAPGAYSVRLTATNPQGTNEALKINHIIVVLDPPVADFGVDTTAGVAPLTVNFEDQSQNLPTAWSWDFDDDGSTDSTERNPQYVYSEPGDYTVKLTASNAAGSNEITRFGFIRVGIDVPDEVTGLALAGDRSTVTWDAHPDACAYHVVRGDLALLKLNAGNFLAAQMICIENDGSDTVAADPVNPAPGQAFFYLTRAVSCLGEQGTYNTSAVWQFASRDTALQGPGAPCACSPVEDVDGDDYCNAEDNCNATFNPSQADSDSDGLGDACDECPADPNNDVDLDSVCGEVDNCPTVANFSQGELDGDGIGDACDPCTDSDGDGYGNPSYPANTCLPDNCPDVANPTQVDQDLDGRGDACDVCPDDVLDDADMDGVCGSTDNCPGVANALQTDLDGDGIGDFCDPCTDYDGDGYGNPGFPNTCDVDNCPFLPNPDQIDTDGDGLGDPCDVCPGDPGPDPDMDGVCGAADNCPDVANASQSDFDGDGEGDACDACTDSDGDLFGDEGFPANTCPDDNCPFTVNPDQDDPDADGIGSACDVCPDDPSNDIDKDSICGQVDNCPNTPNDRQTDADSDGRGDECDCAPLNEFCSTDCTDDDGDGFCITTDCDETNANCTSDCTDDDADGFCVTTDCDDVSPTAADTFPGAAPNDDPVACMKDVDGDDFGDDTPPAGVTPGTDCDDADTFTNPDRLWYADTDQDGFGDPEVTQASCTQPAGFLADNTDCDDTGPAAVDTFPGAAPNDSGSGCMKDVDGDDYGDDNPPAGVTPGTDCDDDDAFTNPDRVWYADTDGDGFGDPNVTQNQCTQPLGHVPDNTDCDDTGPAGAATFPGAAPNDSAAACMKDADGDDYGDDTPIAGVTAGTDCDDDDAFTNPDRLWYADSDADGFGNPGVTQAQCTQPSGHVADSTDCDDTSPTAAVTFPGAAPKDAPGACMKDADGDDYGDDSPLAGVAAGTDCDDADPFTNPDRLWFADTDADGFGDPGATQAQCTQPAGHVADSTDCDDTSPSAAATFPGAAPNDSGGACMKDSDADDYGDDNPPAGVNPGSDCDDADPFTNPDRLWYADTDGDGFGDPDVTQAQCTQPAGHVADSSDCDDTGPSAANTFPGAAPNDSGSACMKDADGDDYGDDTPPAGVTPGNDCDDADSFTNPDRLWYADTDADGFGDPGVTQAQCTQPAAHVADSTDCDDTSASAPSTFPGAAPNDSAGACMKDVDGDDYGDDSPPAGVAPGTDCDDDDLQINPDTIWYADNDGDGFGSPTESQVSCTQPAGFVLNNTDCRDGPGASGVNTYPGAAPNDSPTACMRDNDHDDWGDANPPATVTPGTDCNDSDATLNPATLWYADDDGDGFGDPSVSLTQCAQPAGFVRDATDCDDASNVTFPGAAPADGAGACMRDSDGDDYGDDDPPAGVTAGTDCDDSSSVTFPGAAPNDSGSACMKDTDGDDYGDDSPPGGVTPGTDCDDTDSVLDPDTVWYADTDGDGYGDPGVHQTVCVEPAGHVLDNTDCDDTGSAAADTFPGAAPNDSAGACMKDADGDDYGDDNPPAGVTAGADCDDDDAFTNPDRLWYADTDGDGFGDPNVTQASCTQPAGHLADSTDCDDTSATAADTFPGAAPNDSGSACMKDSDGDDYGDDTPPAGVTAGTDCDDSDAILDPDTAWYADTDGDGFGNPNVSQISCTQPAGHVLDDSDCDDTSPTAADTFPGAAPDDSAGACMKDSDGDDFGDDSPPAGVTPGTDCDDTDAFTNPDRLWYADTDGDGFGDPSATLAQCTQPAGYLADNTDCDDLGQAAASTFPGAAPNDNPGACMKDADGDDYGDDDPPSGVTRGTDCDDDDAFTNPDRLWYADTDADGFGDPNVTQASCTQPAGHQADSSDCDDTSGTAADTFPGAAPNDSAGACMKDSDGDDYGDDSPPAGVTAGTDCNDADAGIDPDTIWYADTDGDGFGDPNVTQVSCTQPAGHVLDNPDCADTGPAAVDTFPGAAPNDSASACMKDADGDDYGDDVPPAGVNAGTDCDDDDAFTNPDRLWYADTDADGFGDPNVTQASCTQPAGHLADNTDCDDTSPTAADTFPGAAPNDSAGACMKDTDGDDYGDDSARAGVAAGSDCDDDDANLNPDTAWYQDGDGDGFGRSSQTQNSCTQPAGYVANSDDCDDTSPTAADTFPGAAPNDSALACMKDTDGDDYGDDNPPAGVTAGTDCDDGDAFTNPDRLWYADTDGDDFGDPNNTLASCTQPAGRVADNTDCDDTGPAGGDTFPGAAPNDSAGACMKDADGDDYGDDTPPAGVTAGTDCDDDDAFTNPDRLWYADTDGDGFGDPDATQPSCTQPAGHLADNTDCDDTSPTAGTTFPGAAPNDSAVACMKDTDGDDYGDDSPRTGVTPGTDCDDTDPGINPDTVWYADTDGDGFGNSSVSQISCSQPASHLLDDTDCDDTSPTAADTFPGAAPADSGSACMKDADGDDFGDDAPPAGVTPGTDCDDDDAFTNPDRLWYADTDGDGYGDPKVTQASCTQPAGHLADNTDCDDTSASASATFPGAAPNDSADACMKDSDGDDYGDSSPAAGVTPGTDCNDADPGIHPGTQWYADTDSDGFGDPGVSQTVCAQPAGHVLDNTDCDDTGASAADTFPGAAPNDSAAACMKDSDNDDYGDDGPPAGVSAGSDCDDDSTTAADTFPGAAPNDSASACMKDSDGDDYGDVSPPAGVSAGTDCDDDDAAINPGTTWYNDADLDGFGDPSVTQISCTQPAGYLLDNTDCDDTSGNAAVTFPGSAENDSGTACMKDSDGDGWGSSTPPAGVTAGTDCNDNSNSTFPGAAPNDSASACMKDSDNDDYGSDSPPAGVTAGTDCVDSSGSTYPGNAPNDDPAACMKDSDGDNYGDVSPPVGATAGTDCNDLHGASFPGAAPNDSITACMKDSDGDDFGDDSPPAGVTPGTDCDDTNTAINPNRLWYADTDNDTYGDLNSTQAACTQPAGYVSNTADCDDTSATAADTFPGAAPNDSAVACMKDKDGDDYGDDSPGAGIAVGTDCDDDDAAIHPNTVWNRDADADGFGNSAVTQTGCAQPSGYVFDGTDCDDTGAGAAATFPGAAPNDSVSACMKDADADDYGDDTPPGGVSAGTDCDDGDGAVNPASVWYLDSDGDGFGDATNSQVTCNQPAGRVLDDTDCDDTSSNAANTFPGAAPNDSAGACMKDSDSDDYGDDGPPAGVTAGTDCDDNSPTTFPGAAPNDSVGACMKDSDNDDYGSDSPPAGVTAGTDCVDTSAATFVGAAPNDNPVACMKDADGDDYGSDSPPAGATAGTDCDDLNGGTFLGAAPNDDVNACMRDVDGDDYGSDSPPAGVTVGTDCNDLNGGVFPGQGC